MSNIAYSAYSILEKALLIQGLIYIVWIVWVVPNDRRRARNTAALSFLLSITFFCWLLYQQHKIARSELGSFYMMVNEKMHMIDKLTTKKSTLESKLLDLQEGLKLVDEEKRALNQLAYDRSLYDSHRNQQYSDQYLKVLAIIDNTETLISSYRISLDSALTQTFTAARFDGSTTDALEVILSWLESYSNFDMASPIDYVQDQRLALESVNKKTQSLAHWFQVTQDVVHNMDNQIISARHEMLRDIKLVYLKQTKTNSEMVTATK